MKKSQAYKLAVLKIAEDEGVASDKIIINSINVDGNINYKVDTTKTVKKITVIEQAKIKVSESLNTYKVSDSVLENSSDKSKDARQKIVNTLVGVNVDDIEIISFKPDGRIVYIAVEEREQYQKTKKIVGITSDTSEDNAAYKNMLSTIAKDDEDIKDISDIRIVEIKSDGTIVYVSKFKLFSSADVTEGKIIPALDPSDDGYVEMINKIVANDNTIIKSSDIQILTVNSDGSIEYVNKKNVASVRSTTKFTAVSVLSSTEITAEERAIIQQIIAIDDSVSNSEDVEVIGVNPDGTVQYVTQVQKEEAAISLTVEDATSDLATADPTNTDYQNMLNSILNSNTAIKYASDIEIISINDEGVVKYILKSDKTIIAKKSATSVTASLDKSSEAYKNMIAKIVADDPAILSADDLEILTVNKDGTITYVSKKKAASVEVKSVDKDGQANVVDKNLMQLLTQSMILLEKKVLMPQE
jgi:hypothetical protein